MGAWKSSSEYHFCCQPFRLQSWSTKHTIQIALHGRSKAVNTNQTGPIKGIGQWLSEAVERPLETPEDWDLETRLACWAIALRGRAWNHWIDRFDIGSTDKATRGHARDD